MAHTQIDLVRIAFENLERLLGQAPYPPRDADESAWAAKVDNAVAELRDELIDLGVDIR